MKSARRRTKTRRRTEEKRGREEGRRQESRRQEGRRQESGRQAKKDDKDKDAKKPVVVKVDLDGIQDRLVALEIPPGNYSNLRLVDDRIFYLRRTVADDDQADDATMTMTPTASRTFAFYSLEDRKETVLGDVNNYEITADGKKMLVKIKKDYAIIDLPKDKLELKDDKDRQRLKLKLAGLDMMLDRHAEWNQIYHESWRQMRDFFYAPNMHGVDWKAMRDKYAALVPFVNHRNDLTYLIGELIGELNIGHAYVGGGERPETPRIKLGLLGAEFSRDAATKAYRIERILPGENWNKRARSPLTAIGVNVKPGDYILAVNGIPFRPCRIFTTR